MTQLELEAYKAGPALRLPVNDVVMSADEDYRYLLTKPAQRERNDEMAPPNRAYLLFVMLNPSTADASKDDPTIRKCLGFATRLGYGGIRVANLYAYRTSSPAVLAQANRAGIDIVSDVMNDRHIRWAMQNSHKTVVAWGKAGPRPHRVLRVVGIAEECAVPLYAIGVNTGRETAGMPKHPLMTPYATPLTRWSPP